MCKGRGKYRQTLTLPQMHVTHSCVDIVAAWLSRVDHEAVSKLHALGSLTTQLAGHHHLATLGSRLHDEAQHTIASTGGQNQGKDVVH